MTLSWVSLLSLQPSSLQQVFTVFLYSDFFVYRSGWIKNADGKWVQDPDVEFDSDEYEPSISPD